MKRFLVYGLIVSMLCIGMDIEAFANGGSRGGGFSSSRSSSSVRSSSSSSAPKPVTTTPASKPSFSSSRPNSSTTTPTTTKPVPKSSANDSAVSKKATTANQFSSRTQAESAFKSKYSSQYTSKYSKEPSTRPSHVPQSTNVGGKTVNVTYNQSMGGYGYMHPTLGTFMLYDAMTDMAMMSMLMNNHGYHVAPAAGSTVVYSTPSPWSGLYFFLTFLFVLMIIAVVFTFVMRS